MSGRLSAQFVAIQQATQCPFAMKSKIVSAPAWRPHWTLDRNIEHAAPDLAAFADRCIKDGLDGWLFECPDVRAGDTLEALAATVRGVVYRLWEIDPRREGAARPDFGSPGYRFSFGGMRMFILTFAPCYPRESSRFGFGQDSTFLLFQPDSAFDRFADPRTGRIPRSVRTAIRSAYMQHGRPYDGALSDSPWEAFRFVKSLRLQDPLVAWWIETAKEK